MTIILAIILQMKRIKFDESFFFVYTGRLHIWYNLCFIFFSSLKVSNPDSKFKKINFLGVLIPVQKPHSEAFKKIFNHIYVMILNTISSFRPITMKSLFLKSSNTLKCTLLSQFINKCRVVYRKMEKI